jgi:hypothetical protein
MLQIAQMASPLHEFIIAFRYGLVVSGDLLRLTAVGNRGQKQRKPTGDALGRMIAPASYPLTMPSFANMALNPFKV